MAVRQYYLETNETTGARELKESNKRQLIKVYETLQDAEDALANGDISDDEIISTKEQDTSGSAITSQVSTGNLNPITSSAVASFIPIGVILPFASDTIPNEYWLLCNGSTFDTDKYPDLYSLLGSSTLPDLRNRTPFGIGSTVGGISTVRSTSNGSLPNFSSYVAPASEMIIGKWNSPSIAMVGGSHWDYVTQTQRATTDSGVNPVSTVDLNRVWFTLSDQSSLYKDSVSQVVPSSYGVNFIIKAI